MMNENEEEREMEVCTAPGISQMATEMISLDLLPHKSRHIYEQRYSL